MREACLLRTTDLEKIPGVRNTNFDFFFLHESNLLRLVKPIGRRVNGMPVRAKEHLKNDWRTAGKQALVFLGNSDK